jgi:plasmid stabilization system protein ParE
MSEESHTDDAEAREIILAQFTAKWGEKDAERRVRLLEEAIPRLYDYAKLNNARVDISIHPEHLEHYVMYLQPRVRAILEHVGPKVIDKIDDSLSADERLSKIMRLVNMMDEKAAANKEKEDSL